MVPCPSRGPTRCSSARTGATITRGGRGQGVVGLRRQRVQDGQPPPHRLGLGADALEGQRLPRRQDGDRSAQGAGETGLLLLLEQAGQVVAQPVGVETGRRDHDDRTPVAQRGQRGRGHGLRRLGHGHGDVRRPDEAGQRRLGPQQPRQRAQAARTGSDVPPAPASSWGVGTAAGGAVSVLIGSWRGQRVAPEHGRVDAVRRDALDRVGRRLQRRRAGSRARPWAAAAGRATHPGPRSAACPRRCGRAGSRWCAGARRWSAARCGPPVPHRP